MESKEKLLDIIDIANQGKLYEEDTEMVLDAIKSALKDLEELEELKKIMGTPIQDIMKRLEILEILKKNIEIVDTDFVDENGDDIFKIQLKPLDSSNQRKVKEWLDGK